MPDQTTTKAIAIIDGALKLFENEKAWAKGAEAFTTDGDEVNADDKDAVRWCMLGAFWRFKPNTAVYLGATRIVADIIRDLHPKFDSASNTDIIANFNDDADREIDEVREVLQIARDRAAPPS